MSLRDRAVSLLRRCYLAVEDWRVSNHLRRAEQELGAKDNVREALRDRRETQLDRLRTYWRRGVFPRNTSSSRRKPCFRGESEETLCAVGYLMAEDGEDDLVNTICDADNNVWLEDVESEAVRGWVRRSGLTREEAARIQPTYGGPPELATSCSWIGCDVAGYAVGLAAAVAFGVAEWAGYQLASDVFPSNALKRRLSFISVSVMNACIVVLASALVFALFP